MCLDLKTYHQRIFNMSTANLAVWGKPLRLNSIAFKCLFVENCTTKTLESYLHNCNHNPRLGKYLLRNLYEGFIWYWILGFLNNQNSPRGLIPAESQAMKMLKIGVWYNIILNREPKLVYHRAHERQMS